MSSFIINPYAYGVKDLSPIFTETLSGSVAISNLVYQDVPITNQTETLSGSVAISNVIYEPLSRDAGANGTDGLIYTETTSSGSGFIDTTRGPAVMRTTGAQYTNAVWGLYAGTLTNQNASYTLNLGTLAVNQYVQLDVALGYLESGMRAGFALETLSGTIRANIFYQGFAATDGWKVIDSTNPTTPKEVTGPTTTFASGNWIIDATYNTIRFTIRSGNTYDISFDGTNITNSSRTIAATDIARVRFYVSTAGTAGVGSNWDQLFNNLVVG